VSIATLGYGVCLVSFGLAFAYLLKDGISSESVAAAVIGYGLLVFLTVGTYGRSIFLYAVPFRFQYTVNTFLDKTALPLRSVLPVAGPLMLITFLVLLGALAMFVIGKFGQEKKASGIGWMLFRTAAVLQVLVVATVFFQVKNTTNIAANIPQREYPIFATWMGEQMQQPVAAQDAQRWVSENSSRLGLSLTSNPVDF